VGPGRRASAGQDARERDPAAQHRRSAGDDPVIVWSESARPNEDIDDWQSRLLDKDRLLVTRRFAAGYGPTRLEIHRIGQSRGTAPERYADISPGAGYVVTRGDDKDLWSTRLVVSRSGPKEPPIMQYATGVSYWGFSQDDRWLAVRERNLDLVDLAAGRRIASFAGMTIADFSGGDRVAWARTTTDTMLVPLDPALAERFARWLVSNPELSPDERCMHLPERSGCAGRPGPTGDAQPARAQASTSGR
jgi:hypothetical protein